MMGEQLTDGLGSKGYSKRLAGSHDCSMRKMLISKHLEGGYEDGKRSVRQDI